MEHAPIVHEYELRCGPEQAFDVYARRIGEWWPPNYSADPETFKTVTIEPSVGGRVFATHTLEGEFMWGEVLAWEPARRLVYTSSLAQSPAHPSHVSVEFQPHGDGCRVRFEHGGWTDDNATDRSKFSDWPVILDRFAALADAGVTPP